MVLLTLGLLSVGEEGGGGEKVIEEKRNQKNTKGLLKDRSPAGKTHG